MNYIVGLDIGSVFAKAVVVADGSVMAHALAPSGGRYAQAAERALSLAVDRAGIKGEEIAFIAATGIGAPSVSFSRLQISDVSCQGRGVHHLFPQVRTVINMGGQSTKVIRVGEKGQALDFTQNEKCAAGSGRFLQVIAKVLQLRFEELGPLSLISQNPAQFTTGCAVFAESEAISRIAEGTLKEDIVAGVHQSLVTKLLTMVRRVGEEREIAFTGGPAKDTGLVRRLELALGGRLLIPKEPLITAALGAALIAQEASD